MFPPAKKKPAMGGVPQFGGGKPKPPMGGGGGSPKPAPHSPDDLESPDPVEGKAEEDSPDDAGMLAGGDDATPPDMGDGLGGGYGAKLEKDIESVGAALGMDAGQAKKAAGAFFMTAAQCLMGGDEGDAEGAPDGDEMIDTEGGARPGRYGQ